VVVSSHQAGLLGIRPTRNGDQWEAKLAWTSKPASMNFSSPVEKDGYLYGLGPSRNLVCVEIATGETRWSEQGVVGTSADKAHAGFIVIRENILMLTDQGELRLFAASPEGYRELGRAQVCGTNWCNPAYSDGVLYLRDGMKQNGRWKAIRLQAAKPAGQTG
jgi:outer membrane protein assembly factor BamB